jgi:RIO kinase 1
MATKGKEKFKTYGDVFDMFTINTLVYFMSNRYFLEGTLSTMKIGKEANIFSAKKEDGKKICIKIYRLETANFNKMFEYIHSDPRFLGLLNSKRKIIFAWVQREYRNLNIAEKAEVTAPRVIKSLNNVLLMDFIGKDDPAPMLKDAPPKDKEKFFDEIIENMRKLYKAGFVHGDLSPYNILNYRNKPYFIDLSHTTSNKNPIFTRLLDRDITNMANYFQKQKVIISEEDILKRIKA